MKTRKRILCFLLAAVMTCSMGLAVNSTEAEAARQVGVTKYIRCGVGEWNSTTISVDMPGKDDTIKNIKVYEGKKTTKNLVVQQTQWVSYTNSINNYYAKGVLTLYAKKKGTYKIKFDVYKNKKSKRSSHTITVRANGNSASVLNKVTVDGKKVYDADKATNNDNSYAYYTSAESGKVKFTLDEGCKITKITVSTYKKNSNSATSKKSFKNGKRITFGKDGYTTFYSNDWHKPMWGSTAFEIIYRDKNDKKLHSEQFYIYRR